MREWRGRTLFIPRAQPERHERVRTHATVRTIAGAWTLGASRSTAPLGDGAPGGCSINGRLLAGGGSLWGRVRAVWLRAGIANCDFHDVKAMPEE